MPSEVVARQLTRRPREDGRFDDGSARNVTHSVASSKTRRASVAALLAVLLSGTAMLPGRAPAVAAAVPTGFQESVVWSGLVNPTAIRFAADGRVFVAEKSGVIKAFDSLADPTPTVFGDLTTNVHNYWDRGLLGLALDPSLTGGTGTGSYVYVLYTYDHILGSTDPAPRWGDACPSPPGATTDGCVVSGRLSRLAVSGTTISGPEQVLIEDWCQQYPSHSVGSLAFGPDGALYVSAGDGASFTTVDYGQRGGTLTGSPTPKNPCGDPPGDAMTPPTAEGGALRSQDVRTASSGSGAAYSAEVLADRPLAYWRLGETSGTVADDAVGAANGTYLNTPTLGVPGALAGDSDTAVRLTASQSEYIDVSTLDEMPAQLSLEAWVNSGGNAISDVGLLGWWESDSKRAQIYWPSNSELRVGITTSTSPPLIVTGLNALSNEGWHHVVATSDGTATRLYFDGQLVGGPMSRTFAGGAIADTFKVGQFGSGLFGTYPNASFDEVAIYDYALSPAQVAHHYAVGGQSATSDPTTLDGAILRVNPATGAGLPGNPFAASSDANARRIIAYGLRNPFRIAMRPGTNELWIGDVGWDTWEEVNRITNVTDGAARNFGWPCYEGSGRQAGYDGADLDLCESLYAQGAGAITGPHFAYRHGSPVVSGESCATGSSSITGLAFYPAQGGSFPAAYHGGLFFSDYSRDCIWFMPRGANGQPDPGAVQAFAPGAVNPVDLVVGPNGDLFYVDLSGGTVRRISWGGGNQAPVAVIEAVPTSGPAPLTVQFSGSGSFDPEGTALSYAWDLDGDGQYDDATGVSTSWTYQSPGNVTVRLRVTDAGSATGTTSQVISVANTSPVPVISTPTGSTTWQVGQQITFSGSATDDQDGALPASALSWSLVLQHCPSSCHPHAVQSWSGVSSGSFNAPDHEYPSHLELTLTATDTFGSSASTTVRLDPRTVVLGFQTSPTGLSLAVNQQASITPFSRTVIVGSSNSVSATSPQLLNGLTYAFASWSDGLAQSHQIVAPGTNTTYTATYEQSASTSVVPSADAYIRWNKSQQNFGTDSFLRVRSGQFRSYLKFNVSGLSGPPDRAVLRLWVTAAGRGGGSVYLVSNAWTETGITWGNAPSISGSALSGVGGVTAGTWIELDVTAAITGNGTYSFAISDGGNNQVDYASRETSNAPTLILTP